MLVALRLAITTVSNRSVWNGTVTLPTSILHAISQRFGHNYVRKLNILACNTTIIETTK